MKQRFPEVQRDADTSAAIVAHLSFTPPFSPDEQLAIYQGRKLEVSRSSPSATSGGPEAKRPIGEAHSPDR